MNTILEIFKSYNGTGYYCILFIISLIYLWFTEEDKRIKALLVYTPTVIQVLFFIPFFYFIYEKLDSGTYYRILWLLPMTVVIAYAGCKLIGVNTKIGLAILSVILVLSGTYVYGSVYMTKATNEYHLPQEVVDVCDMIKPEEGRERVWAVVPLDMIHTVRQYTTDIQLAYGRDSIVYQWLINENQLYRLYMEPTMDLQKLSDLSTEYYCNYVVLDKGRILTGGEIEDFELNLIGETEHYNVYRNTRVDFWDDVHSDDQAQEEE